MQHTKYFRIHQNDGTVCHMQGTISASGAGGDMQLDNTNIAIGQQITITTFTITAGGATTFCAGNTVTLSPLE